MRRYALVGWLGLGAAVVLIYLAVSAWGYGFLGFPLDDAWIHQTYARNLAETGQMAFVPGLPSAGSTAPLWSLLLSLGYVLGVPFKWWVYGLGALFLGLTGYSMAGLVGRLFPQRRFLSLLVGLFCVVEWHLIWAAASGMETMLFVWLSVLLVERYLAVIGRAEATSAPHLSGEREREEEAASPAGGRELNLSAVGLFGLGLLGGLLALTRPEGIGLVGLIGLDIGYRWWRQTPRRWADLLFPWGLITGGLFLLLVPYILFHLWLTGLPFPNTLYAKQAEYGVILQTYPLWWRLFGNIGPAPESVQGVFRVVFIGAQILLLPGLAFAAWITIRERRTDLVFIWAWWASYLLLYGIRLPVTYQHGRYQIPAIVWLLLLGGWGTALLIERIPRRSPWGRAFRQAIPLTIAVLAVAFVGVGAQAYGRDVRFIETEMVATAHWLDENTPPDALLAAHDIGAIGYFTRRPLLDLAGLITPEVIPFIRDEAALLAFMQKREAVYLVTFPGWYPQLTAALTPVYETGAPYAPRMGGENMAVYRLE